MTDLLPWDACPDLQLERLQLLAEHLRDVRHDALEIHDEVKGDDAQVHGTVAYARSCRRIKDLATSGKHPWLGIIDPSRRFIFSIGGMSMRMYRGDSRRPPERSLRSFVTELVAMQMDLPFEESSFMRDDAGWVWRMAIETDISGLVVRVVVFQTNPARNVRHLFEIPMRGAVAEISPVTPLERPGKELSPAPVGKKKVFTESDDATNASPGGEVIPFPRDRYPDGEE